jgi:uncharacterized protein YfaS (alpha-2-macroglobulin family)
VNILKKLLYVILGAIIAVVLLNQVPGLLAPETIPEKPKVVKTIEKESIKPIDFGNNILLDKDGLDSSKNLTVNHSIKSESPSEQTRVENESSKKLPSRLEFDESAYVLNRGVDKEVAINATNIDWFNLRIYRLDERALTNTLSTSVLLDKSISAYRLQSLMRQSVNEIWRGRIEGNSSIDKAQDIALPINSIFKNHENGVFLIVAEDQAKTGFDYIDGKDVDSSYFAIQWVNFTDLSLTSYTAENGIYTSVRSFKTGQSIGEVNVSLVAENNEILEKKISIPGEMIHFSKAITNGSGAHKPRAFFATNDEGDFAFLDLQKPALDLTNFDIAGYQLLSDQNIFLYTDRGIYRPGELVRVSGLIRNEISRPLLDVPVTISITNPKGIVHRVYETSSTKGGLLQQEITLPSSAMRGQWTATAISKKNTEAQFELSFEVKDFVPELIEASIEDTDSKFGFESITDTVTSRFLYGAPASDLNYESELKFTKTRSPFINYPDYVFGDDNENVERKIVSLNTGKLDENGKATLNANLLTALGKQTEDSNLYFATLGVSIQETGGRFKNVEKRYFVDKAEHYIGIKPDFNDDEIDSDSKANFKVLSINSEGEHSLVPLKWKLEKINYFYRWSQNRRGYWNYSYEEEHVKVEEGKVDFTNGKNISTLTTGALPWGHYRLVVDGGQSSTMSSEYLFYSGYVWDQQDSESPSRLELFTDKKSYKIGDEIKVYFDSAVDGVAQVIVANESIHKTLEVPVKKGSNEFNLIYKPQFKLGAYIMANVIRNSDSKALKRFPVRSVGMSWIAFETSPIEINMALPANVEPRQVIKVPVEVDQLSSGPIHLKVNAVDEGILSLTNFKTPDPFEYFWGQRRFSIDVRDEYNRLLTREGKGSSIRTGAGSDGGGSVGGAGLTVVPAKSISLFDNEVQLDSSGRGFIELAVPDFQGRLRLMAVASSNKSTGSVQKYLTVRDKVVSTVVMPNFLAPDDESVISVRYFNPTEIEQAVSVSWKSNNEILEVSESKEKIKLAPKASRTLTYPLKAIQNGIGQIELIIATKEKEISRKFDLQVRYQGVAVPRITSTYLDKGPFTSIGKKVDGLSRKTVSFSPLKNMNVGLLQSSVKNYSYNCSEQLTNIGLPMLEEFTNESFSNKTDKDKIELKALIQENVDTLTSRVNSYGRMGLWSYHSSEIVSSLYPYIVEYLLRARNAGITISDSQINALTDRMLEVSYRYSSKANEKAFAAYVASLKDPENIRYTHQLDEVKDVLGILRKASSLKMVGLSLESENALQEAITKLNLLGASKNVTLQAWEPKQRYDYYQSELAYQLNTLLYLSRLGQTKTVLGALSTFAHVNKLTRLNLREKSLLLQVLSSLVDSDKTKVKYVTSYLPKNFLGSAIDFDSTKALQSHTFEFASPLWVTETIYTRSTKAAKGYSEDKINETILDLNTGQSASLDQLKVGDKLKHSVSIQMPISNEQFMVNIPMPAGLEVVEVLKSSGVYLPYRDNKYNELDTLQSEFDRIVASSFSSTNRAYTIKIEFVTRAVTAGEYVKPGVRLENMYITDDMAVANQVRIKIQ